MWRYISITKLYIPYSTSPLNTEDYKNFRIPGQITIIKLIIEEKTYEEEKKLFVNTNIFIGKSIVRYFTNELKMWKMISGPVFSDEDPSFSTL